MKLHPCPIAFTTSDTLTYIWLCGACLVGGWIDFTTKELAAELGISISTTNRSIRKLIAVGLLTREADKSGKVQLRIVDKYTRRWKTLMDL